MVDESTLLFWGYGTGPRQTAEGIINLTLSYALHNQPFEFRVKVAQPGFTGCVRLFVQIQRCPNVSPYKPFILPPHFKGYCHWWRLCLPPASFSVSVQGSTVIQHTFYLMSAKLTFCQAAAKLHFLDMLYNYCFPHYFPL